MNNSPIDVLLQLPVPRVEPAQVAARPRDESSAFDNHFRQASHQGAAPPPAPASQPAQSSTDTPSHADAQTPAAATDRSSSSQAKTSTELHSESESTDTTPVAADEASSNEDEHAEDATADDGTPAVAVAALEQVAAAAPPNLDGEATRSQAESTDEITQASSDDEQRPRAKDAKPTPRAKSSSAESDAQAKTPDSPNAAGDVPTDAAQVATKDRNIKRESTTEKPAADASASPVKTSDAPPESTVADASQPKTRREGKPHEQTATDTSAAKQPSAQSAANPTQAIKESVAAKKSTGEPIGDAASRKSDKKTSSRSTATPAEASATPAGRPAAIPATADAATTPAAAAVSQPQIPATDVAAAATANSASKTPDTQSASKNNFLSPFARLERGSQSTRGANRTDHAEAARHVDPARFVSRVARAIHTAQERGGPLQLRLSPPELGAMRLELSLNQGALTATIETESSATRQLLLDNLPALRERLAEQSVKIERFDVDVRRDPSGNQQNTAPQDRGQTEHHDRRPGGRNSAQRTNIAAPSIEETAPIRRNISNTSINVVA